MLRTAALPFVLRRSHDIVSWEGVTSTVDVLHGLLRLSGDHLVVQWRASREISRVGPEIRVDRELAPLREVSLPLSALSGARLRRNWRKWFLGHSLILNAADLQAFDVLTGNEGVPGLVLEHPAELILEIRREDRSLARNFVSELRLAISEYLLQESEKEFQAMQEAHSSSEPQISISEEPEHLRDDNTAPARHRTRE